MISFFIKIKHRYPELWNITEKINASLFSMFYKDLNQITKNVIAAYDKENYLYSQINDADIEDLVAFRARQNHKYLIYFDPHPFDKKTFERLLNNKSYSLMKITDKSTGKVVGYFFIRCFFIGKAFHGLITDEKFKNQGLGTSMWEISMEICRQMRIRMFATVSEKNISSLKSASKATDVSVADRLKNDFLLIECCPKKTL